MLTNRQRAIVDELRKGHAIDVHFSPREIARRIGMFGDHAVRLELGRMIIDGEILSVIDARGVRPARFKLRSCDCVACKLD
jgi:hypothetical protein